jgi:hypothetical protein
MWEGGGGETRHLKAKLVRRSGDCDELLTGITNLGRVMDY